MDFDVKAYVTSRSIPSEVSAEWLHNHGFPNAPVITVGSGNSKLSALNELGIDLFVDDKAETIEEINEAGIIGLLRDRLYNEHADHLPRIKYLHQVKDVITLYGQDNYTVERPASIG